MGRYVPALFQNRETGVYKRVELDAGSQLADGAPRPIQGKLNETPQLVVSCRSGKK